MHAPIRGLIMMLAEKYPNAVYQKCDNRCSNVKGRVIDGPVESGCIVGQAVRLSQSPELLANLYSPAGSAVSAETLLMWDISKYASLTDFDVARFSKHTAKKIDCVDPADIRFAQSVQLKQDSGSTWGDAVAEALNEEQNEIG